MSGSKIETDFPTVSQQEIQAYIREGRRLQSVALREALISGYAGVKNGLAAVAHALHIDGHGSANSAR